MVLVVVLYCAGAAICVVCGGLFGASAVFAMLCWRVRCCVTVSLQVMLAFNLALRFLRQVCRRNTQNSLQLLKMQNLVSQWLVLPGARGTVRHSEAQ